MDNQFKSNFHFNNYSRLLLNSPLHVHRCFIDLMESLSGGMFLSQIYNWWMYKHGDWNYKLNKDFEIELGLSEWEIRKAKEKLLELNIIEFKLGSVGEKRSVPFYKINEDNLYYHLQIIADKNPLYIPRSNLGLSDTQPMVERYTSQGCATLNPGVSDTQPHIITDITTDITTYKKKNIKKKKFDEVFDFWKEVFKTPRSQPDSVRQKKVEARIKDGYTVEDIQKAIVGCAVDTWHTTNNVKELKYICRDSDRVDTLSSKFPKGWTIENSLEKLAEFRKETLKEPTAKIQFMSEDEL